MDLTKFNYTLLAIALVVVLVEAENQTTLTTFPYNASSAMPTMETVTDTAGTPVVSLPPAKLVEKCDPTICVEDICHVNGSVSRPTFYARCPDPIEGDPDVVFYCMCANAFHTLASKDSEPSYVPITPDINCEEPTTAEDKNLCKQEKCEGVNNQQAKKVHICESNGKYYCGCFN